MIKVIFQKAMKWWILFPKNSEEMTFTPGKVIRFITKNRRCLPKEAGSGCMDGWNTVSTLDNCWERETASTRGDSESREDLMIPVDNG